MDFQHAFNYKLWPAAMSYPYQIGEKSPIDHVDQEHVV